MSLYVRVYCNFYSHRKTRRLRLALGNDAFWVPPRIWSYAATNQPDGDFSEYTAQDIAEGIGYTNDAQAMLQAMLEAGFIDPDMKLHDWSEHSGFHELYAAKARKAALARWEKDRKEKKETELSGAELSKQSSSSASSNAPSINGTPNNGSPRIFPNEMRDLIKDAESEIEAIRGRGILKDSDREEIKVLKESIKRWKKQRFSQ